MNTCNISEKVCYIGVNDRTTSLFESLWPIPYGVSYNSYLVSGEDKSAIIDGVDAACADEHIAHIRTILGDKAPDYLVINHMEPDHSGAIAALRRAFPDITIVGNAQTLAMVEGFYGAAGHSLTVRDGDTIALGGCSLTFALTPMVHWPETMMTYLAEEKMLFSGDAFGCYGALNGAVVDCDMDTERYFPEMERYYSNIVGKYGQFVQRAMTKLSGMDVATICPTHGPVWRNDIKRVLSVYDRLSRYEPLDNGVTIVYGSMYGNTARMAEAAAEGLAQAGVKNIDIFDASHTHQSYLLAAAFRHKGLIIAAPTYSDTLFPPVAAFMDALAVRGLKGRCVGIIGSHTWSQRAVGEMNARIEKSGWEQVAPAISLKHAPGASDLDAARQLGAALADNLN